MASDDKEKRPEHSIEPDRKRDEEASNKHEVDAPSRDGADDETSEKTTTRQE